MSEDVWRVGRRRVGDAAEHKLDRVDTLVNEGVADREGVAVVLGLVLVFVEVVVPAGRCREGAGKAPSPRARLGRGVSYLLPECW